MDRKRTTIEEKQERVNRYISEYWFGHSPLRFGINSPHSGIDRLQNLNLAEDNPDRLSELEEAVRLVLRISEVYPSIRASDDFEETSRLRYRSAMDIWRHIIYYHTNVTIWDVMEAIYRIRGELYGQFCHVVMRRVFKIFPNEFRHRRLYDQSAKDEYGLLFRNWSRMSRSKNKNPKKKPLAVIDSITTKESSINA